MNLFQQNRLYKHTARATVALGLTAATSIASAMPLTELFFSQNSGFAVLDATGEFPTSNVSIFNAIGANTAGDSVVGETTFDKVEWKGTDFDVFSSLELENFSSDDTPLTLDASFLPDVDGEWNEGDIWVIDTITHINEEIGGGDFAGTPLWVGDTLADLSIFSDGVGGSSLAFEPDSRSQISFSETFNNDNTCSGPSPFFDGNGDLDAGAPDAPGCDDYFDGIFNTTPLTASLDGFIYEIGFTLIPGETAIGSAGNPDVRVGDVLICGDAPFTCGGGYDPAPGVQRVYTPEYGAIPGEDDFGKSSINIAAFWTVRPEDVPAPAPLALIGVGLLGLALRGARKRAA